MAAKIVPSHVKSTLIDILRNADKPLTIEDVTNVGVMSQKTGKPLAVNSVGQYLKILADEKDFPIFSDVINGELVYRYVIDEDLPPAEEPPKPAPKIKPQDTEEKIIALADAIKTLKRHLPDSDMARSILMFELIKVAQDGA